MTPISSWMNTLIRSLAVALLCTVFVPAAVAQEQRTSYDREEWTASIRDGNVDLDLRPAAVARLTVER